MQFLDYNENLFPVKLSFASFLRNPKQAVTRNKTANLLKRDRLVIDILRFGFSLKTCVEWGNERGLGHTSHLSLIV